jgi:hypothetical protein
MSFFIRKVRPNLCHEASNLTNGTELVSAKLRKIHNFAIAASLSFYFGPATLSFHFFNRVLASYSMPYRFLCSDEFLIDWRSETCSMPQLL